VLFPVSMRWFEGECNDDFFTVALLAHGSVGATVMDWFQRNENRLILGIFGSCGILHGLPFSLFSRECISMETGPAALVPLVSDG
jgi:hypothetical protein